MATNTSSLPPQQEEKAEIIHREKGVLPLTLKVIAVIAALCMFALKFENNLIHPSFLVSDVSKSSSSSNSSANNSTSPGLNQQRRQHSSVKFIPYPHRTLGSGDSIQCQWETRHNYNTSSLLDFTQKNALTEGVCIPSTLSNTLHIFSSDEAIQCLSSKTQQRDIRLILTGDSYMKQLYIGLTDILLSKHISNDVEIIGRIHRNQVLDKAQYWMKKRYKSNNGGSFPFVQYRCEEECYGRKKLDVCSKCINSFSRRNNNTRAGGKDDVWVVGVGVHTFKERANRQVNATVQQIQHFLQREEGHNQTIYVSPPAGSMEGVYRDLLPHLAPENPAHPFLDVFQLTKSCTMKNCSFDGGHRSRFVNRWKAQLLLNTLCDVQ